jgi:hypothetical protein
MVFENLHLDPGTVRNMYESQNLTVKEISNRLGVSFWTLYSFMKREQIARKNKALASFNAYKSKPQFEIKRSLTRNDSDIKIAGLMLYWAEGTLKGNTVDLANSNPEIIKIFLRFLREVCGIKEERLRIYLYAYQQHNCQALIRYWSNITGVPLTQFTKPFIRKNNLNVSGRKLPYGLIHVRYNDKKLLCSLKCWLDEFVSWAGT